jgi:peptidoglycan-associated lipoprotein
VAPRPGGPGTAEEFNLTVGDRVFFAYDSFALTQQAQQTLERQAAWLRTYGDIRLTIEGHCDERGTREYNLALGDRRANAVRNFLVARGVAANRITVVSYGKERPVALGSNETAWSLNRRGVTAIQTGARFN